MTTVNQVVLPAKLSDVPTCCLLLLVAIALGISGCSEPSETDPQESVLFGQPATTVTPAPREGEQRANAQPSLAEPVPACTPGDGRTAVPLWQPTVDEKGVLSSDPPQKDGLIVRLTMSVDAAQVQCTNEAHNSFRRPEYPDDPSGGGLAVNIRGNTQLSNGVCHFTGYYMNEDVMGMHQGWVETYFGAVEKQKIVLSGQFCHSSVVAEDAAPGASAPVLTDTDPGYRDAGH